VRDKAFKAFPLARSLRSLETTENAERWLILGLIGREIQSSQTRIPCG